MLTEIKLRDSTYFLLSFESTLWGVLNGKYESPYYSTALEAYSQPFTSGNNIELLPVTSSNTLNLRLPEQQVKVSTGLRGKTAVGGQIIGDRCYG